LRKKGNAKLIFNANLEAAVESLFEMIPTIFSVLQQKDFRSNWKACEPVQLDKDRPIDQASIVPKF
jgi:hypothetical protein